MNTRRFRPAAGSVSLFPFLAVLICTMGSLIVLLVVVVRQSREAAEQPAVAELTGSEEAASDGSGDPEQLAPDEELADLKWQIETIQQSREATQKQLQDAQLRLSMTEDQMRDLSAELDRLERRAQQIEAVRAQQLADQSRQEQKLQALQATITQTEQELAAARERAARQQPRYAIVPYAGLHGTDRRPIYVECLSDRIVLQPEGIELFPSDFAQATRPDNPLASAVRAAREYWLDNRVLNSAAEAYPLLIVRPQGVDSYHGCRAALDGWDDDFGYELIPADIELQFPDPDPTLGQTMLDAIADARLRGNLPTPAPRRTAAPGSGAVPDGKGPGGMGLGGEGNGNGDGGQGVRAPRPGEFQPATAPSRTGNRHDAMGSSSDVEGSSASGESTFAPLSGGLSFPENAAGASGSATAGGGSGSATAGGGSCFADQRGSNWALPSSANGSIGTSRPVVITIRASQISMAAESGTTVPPQSFAFQSSVKEAIPTFVDALWSRIESWGVAGPSAYWKPTLLVNVGPDGEAAFCELRQLMERSGLTIERRTGR